jgi:hypothetical protein
MDGWAIAILSSLATLVVVGLVLWIRRTPTLGGPAEPARPRRGLRVFLDPEMATDETGAKPGLRIRKTVVTHRMAITAQPGNESIGIDGQEYRSIDDIPDLATRDRVRSLFGELASEVKNPQLREKVEQEMRDVGIEPTSEPLEAMPQAQVVGPTGGRTRCPRDRSSGPNSPPARLRNRGGPRRRGP